MPLVCTLVGKTLVYSWRTSLCIPLSSWPDAVSVRVPGGEQTEGKKRKKKKKQLRPEIFFFLHIQNLGGHALFTEEDEEHTLA